MTVCSFTVLRTCDIVCVRSSVLYISLGLNLKRHSDIPFLPSSLTSSTLPFCTPDPNYQLSIPSSLC